MVDVHEEELTNLYTWVDEIPLSRPKRNIARDFADGVLLAEIVHHYFPKLVELHNYSSANGIQQKLYNWNTLNQKVFRRLGFMISKQDCEAIATCAPGAIERVLKLVKLRIAKFRDAGGDEGCARKRYGEEGGEELRAEVSGGTAPAAPRPQRPTPPSKHLLQALQQSPSGSPAPSAYPAASSKVRAQIERSGSDLVPAEVVAEKDAMIAGLRETNELNETKVKKLEQLVKLKDAKIQTLMAKLQAAGLA